MRAVCPVLRPVFSPGGLSPRRKRAGCAAAAGVRCRARTSLPCSTVRAGLVRRRFVGAWFRPGPGIRSARSSPSTPGRNPCTKSPPPRRVAAEALPHPCRCIFRRGTPRFRQAALRFFLRSQAFFALAGPDDAETPPVGPPLHTCTIVTTAADDLVAPVHDPMPVLLPRERHALPLSPPVRPPPLRAPFPAAAMVRSRILPSHWHS